MEKAEKATPALLWLEVFVAVSELGKQEAAAARVGCSQATVSRTIPLLEQWLRYPLFARPGFATLTVGGERFLPKARVIIDMLNESRAPSDEEIAEQRKAAIASSINEHFQSISSTYGNILPKDYREDSK